MSRPQPLVQAQRREAWGKLPAEAAISVVRPPALRSSAFTIRPSLWLVCHSRTVSPRSSRRRAGGRRHNRQPAGPGKSGLASWSGPPVNSGVKTGPADSGVSTGWRRRCAGRDIAPGTQTARRPPALRARSSSPATRSSVGHLAPRSPRPRSGRCLASIRINVERRGPRPCLSPCRWPTVKCSMPGMLTEHASAHRSTISPAREPPSRWADKLGMLTRSDEADLLAVGLVGGDRVQAPPPVLRTSVLRHSPDRQQHPAQPVLDGTSKST